MAIELCEEDRAAVRREDLTAFSVASLRERYGCSLHDLQAAVRRERLLAAVESAKSVEELREVVATLIRTIL